MQPSSLVNHFQDYFEVLLANTPERRDRIHRIRYDVYCREFGYEREEDCPGGLERDDYDEFAMHCLVVHRATGVAAGCIRVVTPPQHQPDFLLPMERFCGASLTDPVLHPSRLARNQVAEVSRLAVHTQFRRRLGESVSPAGLLVEAPVDEEDRRTFPLLGIALFCAGASLMRIAGREQAFVMMERRLARRLQASGFPFVCVGDPMEYHGSRAAYHVTVQQVIESMHEEFRGLFRFVHQSLEADVQDGWGEPFTPSHPPDHAQP